MAADAQSMTSEHSDWSQWVADVFRSALDEHDDGVSEGRSLHTRIKGGGRGVPGIQTQQVGVRCMCVCVGGGGVGGGVGGGDGGGEVCVWGGGGRQVPAHSHQGRQQGVAGNTDTAGRGEVCV